MKALLFGMIAEKANASEIAVSANTTHALRLELGQRISGLDRLIYSIAVDRLIVHDAVPLIGNEEVAVLPPFAVG